MPAITFGFLWRDRGEHRRYGKTMPLWTPEPLSPVEGFSAAWKNLKPELDAAGFSWTSIVGYEGIQPCWWDDPKAPAVDAEALQVRVDAAIEAEAEFRARREAAIEARRVAAAASNAELAAPIRSALAVVIAEHPWQLGRHLAEARRLMAVADWDVPLIRMGKRYVVSAERNAARALERLNRPWLPAWYDWAEDPDVRAAAHEACQVMSDLDTDWASTKNSEGWSQASCWVGHTLSEMEILDRGQAAHALALLHTHRLQLSDELAARCFGEAPVRKKPRPARHAAGGLLTAAGL